MDDPLLPLEKEDIIAFSLSSLSLMIAAGGGVGGGGMLLPIYLLILHFPTKYAIPLSNITVLGGAVANTILNVSHRHPYANRPLIDWELILAFEPLTVTGAIIGAMLNKLLPSNVLVVLLVCVLTYTAIVTLKKAVKFFNKETEDIKKEKDQENNIPNNNSIQMHPMLPDKDSTLSERTTSSENVQPKNQSNVNPNEAILIDEDGNEVESKGLLEKGLEKDDFSSDDFSNETSSQLRNLLEEEKKTPFHIIGILFIMFGIVIVINILKGGGSTFPSPLGIKCNSFEFWIANGVIFGSTYMVYCFSQRYLTARYELKEEVNYKYAEGDIIWNKRAVTVYPLICALAGVCAGMFGIGGGIVKGPLMLALGVEPVVASATSATMILFTSFTATTSFLVFGLVVHDYAVACFFNGLISTFIGQLALSYLMEKFKRKRSLVAFSVGFVVLFSSMLMAVNYFLSDGDDDEGEKISGICENTISASDKF